MRSFSPDSVARSLRRSRGAVTIEFALLFMIFFALFYAIVTYSLVFLLQTSFNHAASEGARSAISIDPQYFSNNNSYMPSGVREIVLGEGNSNVQVVYAGNVLTVRVVYGNYAGNPLIPLLVIPGIGPVFSPAQDIQGTASIRLV
jgi:Flp pilus assembly protein TadG